MGCFPCLDPEGTRCTAGHGCPPGYACVAERCTTDAGTGGSGGGTGGGTGGGVAPGSFPACRAPDGRWLDVNAAVLSRKQNGLDSIALPFPPGPLVIGDFDTASAGGELLVWNHDGGCLELLRLDVSTGPLQSGGGFQVEAALQPPDRLERFAFSVGSRSEIVAGAGTTVMLLELPAIDGGPQTLLRRGASMLMVDDFAIAENFLGAGTSALVVVLRDAGVVLGQRQGAALGFSGLYAVGAATRVALGTAASPDAGGWFLVAGQPMEWTELIATDAGIVDTFQAATAGALRDPRRLVGLGVELFAGVNDAGHLVRFHPASDRNFAVELQLIDDAGVIDFALSPKLASGRFRGDSADQASVCSCPQSTLTCYRVDTVDRTQTGPQVQAQVTQWNGQGCDDFTTGGFGPSGKLDLMVSDRQRENLYLIHGL